RIFGYFDKEEMVVLTNLRIVASYSSSEIRLRKYDDEKSTKQPSSLKGTREVYFREYGKQINCQIYDRAKLSPKDVIMGPAIIEEYDSTTVIYPSQQVFVDQYLNLIITLVDQNNESYLKSMKEIKEVTYSD